MIFVGTGVESLAQLAIRSARSRAWYAEWRKWRDSSVVRSKHACLLISQHLEFPRDFNDWQSRMLTVDFRNANAPVTQDGDHRNQPGRRLSLLGRREVSWSAVGVLCGLGVVHVGRLGHRQVLSMLQISAARSPRKQVAVAARLTRCGVAVGALIAPRQRSKAALWAPMTAVGRSWKFANEERSRAPPPLQSHRGRFFWFSPTMRRPGAVKHLYSVFKNKLWLKLIGMILSSWLCMLPGLIYSACRLDLLLEKCKQASTF